MRVHQDGEAASRILGRRAAGAGERVHKRADDAGQAGHGHIYVGPVFWDIRGSSSPSLASLGIGMMAYMGTIVRVSQDYDGLGWVRYDSAFRLQAALSGNKKWSVINGTLFTMNFSGRSAGTRRCELCFAMLQIERDCAQSGNPDPDLGPVPIIPRVFRSSSGEACRKWNSSGCTFPQCRHLHIFLQRLRREPPSCKMWGTWPSSRAVISHLQN